jgi:hypothetical protein
VREVEKPEVIDAIGLGIVILVEENFAQVVPEVSAESVDVVDSVESEVATVTVAEEIAVENFVVKLGLRIGVNCE